MLDITTLPGTDSVLAVQRDATENFVVCDIDGLAQFARAQFSKKTHAKEWSGNLSYDDAIARCETGDLAAVPASEKLLEKIETLVPESRSWRTFDAPVGAVPNIPQFLAGNPYNMRMRKRTASASAPLSIVVELVASGGIDADDCMKRGVAMLALVRMLSNIRPVELWTVIAIGKRSQRSSICLRLDTAPLDLAHAAHILSHPSVFRMVGYKSLSARFYNNNWAGQWAFANHSLHMHTAKESYARVLNPGNDVLYVPPMHLHDKYITAPTQWLQEMLAEHGGLAMTPTE